MWTLQDSECHRNLPPSFHGHEVDMKTSVLTGSTKNVIECQFLKYAKAPLVVIRLPKLIIVFKSEDGDTGVIATSTVEVDQSGMFIGYRSHCRSIG